MNPVTESARQDGMLTAPLNAVLEQHRAAIVAHISGKSGCLTESLLKSDETVRSIAGYCYDFLPWPVRLAVKKPAFVDFVLAHREPVLAKLAPA